jgi:putative ATP-dependent endonuclease of OLD family
MRISRLTIRNFRGIQSACVYLPKHCCLIGDNNAGKTTILEAIDLVLGPDRLNRLAPVDEHDFYQGKYVDDSASPADGLPLAGATIALAVADSPISAGDSLEDGPRIQIEVVIADLTEQQRAKFVDYVEFWDSAADAFIDEPNPEGIDGETISEALRVTFVGRYVREEDDFEGRTYFTRSLAEGDTVVQFSKVHKQICGFLYLRSLRTGTRALSLERGSLLDIILRLKEVRPQMWEGTIGALATNNVASDPALGISGVLESISAALKKYVPKEWGIHPHLRVSSLTREHLRKVITAFIATGEGAHAAPFYRQGTGTINMLVLAMLSQIAADKQNVIFAMEEPETAIPPYAQKRIVHEVRQLASQAIFTSHSPYVLEEFALDEAVVISRDTDGDVSSAIIELPASVKPKRYRQEFRTRFCEGLLARRILLAEGATEASAFPAACRRLAELNPGTYSSLEALGICTVDAGGETAIADLAKLYRDLGKQTFAICDKQDTERAAIEAQVDLLLMHQEKGFEDLVLKHTRHDALVRFASQIDWPPHLLAKYATPAEQVTDALRDYFDWSKANWGAADCLAQCSEDEMPTWLRDVCVQLKGACSPVTPAAN